MTTFSTQSNTIHVVLSTTSHLNCAFPQDSKRPEDSTTTLTIKKKVKGESVPYFPANGLRGRFRRAIASRIINALGKPVTTDIFLGLTSGSAPTGVDTISSSIEELMRAANHPYMGVFGGGSRMLMGRYDVSDINPILHSTVNHKVVAAPVHLVEPYLDSQILPSDDDIKTLQAYQLTERRTLFKIDDISRGRKLIDMTKQLEGGEEAIATHLQAIANEQATRKQQKGEGSIDVDKKRQINNMLGVEGISPGVDMHFRVDLSPELSEEQIGVILLAIKDLADENYLGGWGRIGFGRFEIKTIEANIPAHDIHEIATDSLYKDEKLEITNERLSDLMESAQDALSVVDLEEIADYFTPKKPKPSKKA